MKPDLIGLFRGTDGRGGGWAVALLLAGLILTAYSARSVKAGAEAEVRQEFEAVCRGIQSMIVDRLAAHEQILRSGAAFFAGSENVSRGEWHEFATHQKVSQKLPGVQGIGFALRVPRLQLEEHIREIRAEGFPGYRVWPEGERETYSSIIFLEPFAGRNRRAFGYDMLSEPVRREAMERARDQDAAALSGKVVLVQETGEDVQAGTLMYAPVYRAGMSQESVAERRAALVGWVYSPYRMNDLLQGMLGRWELAEQRRIQLKIYDGVVPSPEALLFDSERPDGSPRVPAGRMTRQVAVDLAGRRWLLSFAQAGGSGNAVDYSKAWLILGGGAVTSLLLSGLALSLYNTRRNARMMAHQLTADLRKSEERWKFALEGSGDGVWDWNIATGEVVFSPRWKEMLGYAEHEVGAGVEEWRQRIHPEDLARVMTEVSAHRDGRTTAYASEHRVRCKDGSWKWILDRGMVVNRDAGGTARRMIGTHSDITARKNAEEALRIAQLRAGLVAQMRAKLAEATAPKDAAASILETAGEVLGWDSGLMAWWNEADGTLENVLEYDIVAGERQQLPAPTLGVRQPAPLARRALEEGAQLLLRENESSQSDALQVGGTGRRSLSILYAPVWHRDRRIGVISIQSYRRHAYDREALDFFQSMADQCAGVLERIRAEEGLRASNQRVQEELREREMAEAALKDSEARFRALVEWSPEAIVVHRGGRFVYGNPAAIRMIGATSSAELFDQPFLDRVHPDYHQLVLARTKAAAERRASLPMVEIKFVKLDGTAIDVETQSTTIVYNGSPALLVSARDVTARKQMEAALRASEARYRSILHASPDDITITDLAGRIVMLSPMAYTMFGYEPDAAFFLRPIADFIAPEDRERAAAQVVRKIRGEKTGPGEYRGLRRDGSTFEIEVNSEFIRDGAGQPTGIVFVVRDITARKRADDLVRESLREKEALLKEVHHRVKNNLQVITSLLRLEAGRSAQPGTRSVLKDMQSRIQSMALLHEKLYRSGTFAAVDLGGYLKQLATQSFRALAPASGSLQLRLDLASVRVEMDQAMPCGLLANELMANCLKHGFPDGRTGEVRMALQPVAGGPAWCLRVSDTGVGLPADFAVKHGHSLGLQLVSDLARQLGGRLEIGPGPEAVFEVFFTPSQPAPPPPTGTPRS